MKRTISIKQLAIQTKQDTEDLLQLAIGGTLSLYTSLPGPLNIKRHEKEDWSGEWGLLSTEEITSFIHVPVNAGLCHRILLDGYVDTGDFYSHYGSDAIEMEYLLRVIEDQLFAYLEDVEVSTVSKNHLRSKLHGNAKPAYSRNQKIYDVAKKEIGKNPFLFCTESSKKQNMLKIKATAVAEHLYVHKNELFPSADFIDVQHDTVVGVIREGFKDGALNREVKKPD